MGPILACKKLYQTLLCLTAFLSVCVPKHNDNSWYTHKLNNGNYILNPIVKSASIGIKYENEINATMEYIYQFNNSLKASEGNPVRVRVVSEDANRTFPVLVVVRQQKGVLSWQLPLLVDTTGGVYEYHYVERTLCPVSNYYSPSSRISSSDKEQVIVSISTSSPENVMFSLIVTVVRDFKISFDDSNRTFSLTPSQPRFYGFQFPKDTHTALVRVTSDDDLCMTVSIQNITCPVYDLEHNVQFEGSWLTMKTKGGITLRQDRFPQGFYVVFVVQGDDTECSGVYQTISTGRNKTVSFSIEHNISYEDYVLATAGAIAVFILFYIFSIVISVIYIIRKRKSPEEQGFFDEDLDSSIATLPPRSSYAVIHSPMSDVSSIGVPSFNRCDSDSSIDETDIDVLADANLEKDIFRMKTFLYVCDLARKDPRILRKKSQLYVWNLLTIAVFYALPVVQLVVTYQRVLNKTGNQDLCYYNFLCAHPLGLLSDFNHVFSNIGYALLGLLFIILTYRRDRLHKQAVASQDSLERMYGIPQHFGLFYAMGTALMMEGILSGCYHVCPNHSNFQFDTSFMYVISVLLMLKIYQTRHPDINANAYATFGVLAAVIFIGLIGVLEGSLYFYIVFSVVHVLTCIALSAQIYYMGRWNLDLGIFRRVLLTLLNDIRAGPSHCFKPMYPNRMVLLVLGNLCNWGIITFGMMNPLEDFATYLLTIFMANLLLYTMFYIVMKLCHRERILPQPLIYIVLAVASWSAALYFFINKSISWKLTPAQSRTFNQPCFVLDFYDGHDVWHFLSAASMFFSFMVLLTLDDDLVFVQRDKIPVF